MSVVSGIPLFFSRSRIEGVVGAPHDDSGNDRAELQSRTRTEGVGGGGVSCAQRGAIQRLQDTIRPNSLLYEFLSQSSGVPAGNSMEGNDLELEYLELPESIYVECMVPVRGASAIVTIDGWILTLWVRISRLLGLVTRSSRFAVLRYRCRLDGKYARKSANLNGAMPVILTCEVREWVVMRALAVASAGR